MPAMTNTPMKLRNGKNVTRYAIVTKNTAEGNDSDTCSSPARVRNALPVCAHISAAMISTATTDNNMSEPSASSTIASFKPPSTVS